VLMGFMALINVPVCIILGGTAFKALEDYVAQRKAGKDPVFKASSIGVKDTDYWN
ncbi:MAG: alanine:cation symporter family protein, partial [Peptococcaceae bacterium]|nr:alanine:cation symporter family protein [Peptococcaceae bacterium]